VRRLRRGTAISRTRWVDGALQTQVTLRWRTPTASAVAGMGSSAAHRNLARLDQSNTAGSAAAVIPVRVASSTAEQQVAVRARSGSRARLSMWLATSVSLTACAATHQEVRPDGTVLLRAGNTTLGWIVLFLEMMFAGAILLLFLCTALAITGGEFVNSVRSGKLRQALGWAALLPVFVAVPIGMGSYLAANTAFKSQTAVVTADNGRHELTVERRRLLGNDAVHRWAYEDIATIQFDYIPAGNASEGSPPQGLVYLQASDRPREQVYDGAACTARKLADGVAAATGAELRVRSNGRDIAGYGSFLTQLRCGIKEPLQVTDWRRYPSELWRVLDLAFLWNWAWALPVVAGQLALIAAACLVAGRWGSPGLRKPVAVVICVAAGLAVVALHIVATRTYGRWPGALALLALVSARIFAGRFRSATPKQ
jgi:hypothetical protein